MDKITRAQLAALGGAPDARWAVFYPDGQLYFTTDSKEAADDDFWRYIGYSLKEVVD